jgi:hypothetical protein
MKNQPIVIIGAGRSGTNILRDSICGIQGFETWPCDEINYIWRHGNITHPTDRFTADEAQPHTRTFIRHQFEKLEQKYKADYVVEKTCANSLKVPFIDAIFPDAKYLFIIRDGYDVVSSAKERWTAALEIKYILDKAKYVPLSDMPYYGFRYLVNRIKKVFSKENRLAFWGPIYPGMEEDLRAESFIEVCAKQWKECVEIAYSDLSKIDATRVYMIKYEDFVSLPMETMRNVMKFIGVDVPEEEIAQSVRTVSPKSVGNYKKSLTGETLAKVSDIVSPTMANIYSKI